MNTTKNQLYTSTISSLSKAKKTVWWLLKIILPISLAVSFLQYWGVITFIANLLSPTFSIIGLPGESAVVFITSIFVPLYAPIAIIATLPMDMRQITILALMCLISHNLFVETAVQKKTGSSAFIMFFLRLTTSIIAAFALNLLLPEHIGSTRTIQKNMELASVIDMLRNWLINTVWLSLKISLIVSGLMILQNILKEFKILDLISKTFAPFMKVMGLNRDSSFLWFVAQTLGLGYGSAIMIEEIDSKRVTLKNANLLNYHIAINHSLLEDTLLFAAIGLPVGWIIAPRFIFSIIIVWAVRAIMSFKKNQQKKAIYKKTLIDLNCKSVNN